MRFDIITIFPQMFGGIFSGGIVKKAIEKGFIDVKVHDLRDYTSGKHKQVDDRPYGGSPGMVLKPEPLFTAIERLKGEDSDPVYLMSPQGSSFNSRMAKQMAEIPRMILICGRYEGVDERVIKHLVTDEVSIGDYVLTGGEPAAAVIIDAVSRFIPGVVGKMESVRRDSFFSGIFDYPQYTRPREYKGKKVPEILFSGNHNRIEKWRRKKMLEKTWKQRPELLKEIKLSPEEKKILEEIASKEGKNNESN
jgi:tRNA (guanine37-N1)-methyltransferase